MIGNLIVGLIIAIVSALVTVHFALKRFCSEKWWERKADAYGSIIEALHHLKNYDDHHMAFEKSGTELPEEGKKELTDKLRCAMAEVRKRMDVGTFVICEEAVSALHTLMEELDASTKTTNYKEHLNLHLSAVSKCLESMRQIAKKDLGR